MDKANIQVIKLHPHSKVPRKAHRMDAGYDLVYTPKDMGDEGKLLSAGRGLFPTGIALAIPEGYEAQIRPRSGWAVDAGMTVLNSPGTIDAGYRGEVMICLINLSAVPVRIKVGDRIAQMVIQKLPEVEFEEVKEFAEVVTERGTGGFGSTGMSDLVEALAELDADEEVIEEEEKEVDDAA